jgi:hypothetical protein
MELGWTYMDPIHLGLEDIELIDVRVLHAALNGNFFNRPLPPVNLQNLARSILLRE